MPDWAILNDFDPEHGLYPFIEPVEIHTHGFDFARRPPRQGPRCPDAIASDFHEEMVWESTRDHLLMGGAHVALYEVTCVSCYLDAALRAYFYMKAYHERMNSDVPGPAQDP